MGEAGKSITFSSLPGFARFIWRASESPWSRPPISPPFLRSERASRSVSKAGTAGRAVLWQKRVMRRGGREKARPEGVPWGRKGWLAACVFPSLACTCHRKGQGRVPYLPLSVHALPPYSFAHVCTVCLSFVLCFDVSTHSIITATTHRPALCRSASARG